MDFFKKKLEKKESQKSNSNPELKRRNSTFSIGSFLEQTVLGLKTLNIKNSKKNEEAESFKPESAPEKSNPLLEKKDTKKGHQRQSSKSLGEAEFELINTPKQEENNPFSTLRLKKMQKESQKKLTALQKQQQEEERKLKELTAFLKVKDKLKKTNPEKDQGVFELELASQNTDNDGK